MAAADVDVDGQVDELARRVDRLERDRWHELEQRGRQQDALSLFLWGVVCGLLFAVALRRGHAGQAAVS